MMQHQRAQHDIELPVTKWQRLHQCVPEVNFDTSFSCFLAGPGNHLRCCVDPVHMACPTDLMFRRDRQRPGSAAYVQNRLASR
jgi:hypothetical protein